MNRYRYFSVAALVLASVWHVGCSASTERYKALRAQAFPAPEDSAHLADVSDTPDAVWLDASELSLARVLELSLARNPSLAAMASTWRAAVERYPQVTALSDPKLGYALAPATIDSDSSIFGQKIEFSQPFPWPGKLALRGEAALSNAEAAGEDFQQSRQRLMRAVVHAFYDYHFVHRAIDINQINQELLGEFQRIAERRYAVGLSPKGDALHAEVEHQHLVHRGIVLERERGVAQARLNTLLNLPPKDPLPPPSREIPQPASLPPFALLESTALRGRPALQALEHSTQARSAEARLAQREYFPDLSINAGYNSLWEDTDKQVVVGVAINVPLQLGRRRAALNQARAEQRRAEAQLEEERARVLLELSEAYDELEETRHVVHLYASSILPAARESLETARTEYETGANDFLTLVATEKSLHLAELTYEQALAAYQQGRAHLEYAVGEPLAGLEELP